MKTKKQVISENPDYSTLIRAVIDNIGEDYIEDLNNRGINDGFSGFVYYPETVAFFRKHRKQIMVMAERMADEMGSRLLEMVSNFNCLSSGQYPNRKPDYSIDEIAKAIYQGKGKSADIILNSMSWFAAEEVCRMFEE